MSVLLILTAKIPSRFSERILDQAWSDLRLFSAEFETELH